MSYLTLNESVLIFYLVDFLVVLAILAGFRFFSGLVANASLNEVLAEQDNVALGISLAGAVAGIAIMLMGVVSGPAANTLQRELLLMTGYGVLGVLLMWVTRQIFDHVSLPYISIHKQIMANNVAVGLVDAGNLIASAIIVRAVMMWVENSTLMGLGIVLLGFLASQVIMFLATRYRIVAFHYRHPENSLHGELEQGNLALAVRFSGHRIGVALAVTSTSGLLAYQADQLWLTLGLWFVIALGLFAAQSLISFVARLILLPGINVGEEVVAQRNVAIGTLEAAIYIAVGLIFVGFLG